MKQVKIPVKSKTKELLLARQLPTRQRCALALDSAVWWQMEEMSSVRGRSDENRRLG
jgi:hypothetical protein